MAGYRLPTYDPRLRASGAAVGSAGPMANADAFGASGAKDMMALGRAGQQFGESIQRVANIKQHRTDQIKARNALTQARMDYDVWEKDMLKNRKGMDAADLDKEAQAWYEERRKQDLDTFDNVQQRELFNQTFDSMKVNSSAHMSNYAFQQVEAAEHNSRNFENEAVRREAAGKYRYNDDALAGGLATIMKNIDVNLSGQKPETIAFEKQKEARLYHESVAEARAADAPAAALAYLDREDVKEVFTPAELKGLREKLEFANESAEVADDALASAESMSPKEILEKAWTDPKYRDNKNARDQFIRLSADAQNRNAIAKKAERADYVQSLNDAFAQSGYTEIPKEAMRDREIYGAMLDFKSKLASFKGENPIANEDELIGLYNKTPEQIDDFLSKGENYKQYLFWLAGDSDWKSAIESKRKGGQSAGDDGRNGSFGGINVKEMLESHFVRLKGYEGWVSDTEFDSKNPAHQRTRSNFMYHFRKRWRDKEKYHPGLSPDARAEEIFYGMIRENRAGKLELNDPLYDSVMEAKLQAGAENPRVESVNPDTGDREISYRDPDSGVVSTFIKMDEVEKFAFGGVDIREGMRVPDDAEAGTYMGLPYQPGDHIGVGVNRRTGRADAVVVYDKNWNIRPESVDFDIARRGEAVSPLPAERAEPAKTPNMREWEKENNASFVWNKYAGVWIAEADDVNAPGSKTRFEANAEGSMISHVGGGGFADEDFLADVPERQEAGEDIQEKVTRLQSGIDKLRDLQDAFDKMSPGSPMIMKRNLSEQLEKQRGIAAKNAAEIKRLKTEYERVTGKKAKESKFYVSKD